MAASLLANFHTRGILVTAVILFSFGAFLLSLAVLSALRNLLRRRYAAALHLGINLVLAVSLPCFVIAGVLLGVVALGLGSLHRIANNLAWGLLAVLMLFTVGSIALTAVLARKRHQISKVLVSTVVIVSLALLARDIALAVGIYHLRQYSDCDRPGTEVTDCLQQTTGVSRLWTVILALVLTLEYLVSVLLIGIGFTLPGRPVKRHSMPPVRSPTPSPVLSYAESEQLSQQEPRVISEHESKPGVMPEVGSSENVQDLEVKKDLEAQTEEKVVQET